MRSALGAAAMIFVAACASDTPTAPVTSTSSTPSFDRSPDNGSGVGRNAHELRDANGNSGKHGGGGGAGTGIYYHGGPVLQAFTNVAAVYWSSSTIYAGGPVPGTSSNTGGGADGSLIGYFLGHIGGSPYFNINTTYTSGSGAHIANIVNYTQYWANGTSAPSGTTVVSDAQMVAMLQSGFNSGALAYDPNTLYAIFTAGQVNLGGGFGGAHFTYCAYHTHGTVTVGGVSRTVLYAAMPYDAAYPTSCSEGVSPNGDVGADAEVNTLAHELEETTTDPMANAWFDNAGYESADKCAWNFGTTQGTGTGRWNITVGAKNFMVQQQWVNAGSGGCLQHYP